MIWFLTLYFFVVQIQIISGVHKYPSINRVESKMASLGRVAQRAIPLLKKKTKYGGYYT
jgi:hypothetical protein